ncbi:MAG: methionyl-tRNA formyltransferase [Anaerovoracaceae bacterium]|jgi:methionyl-tRNA formyltransferase
MKIAFMGTPDFAVPSLQALVQAGHEIGLVITRPDAVSGRGRKVHFSPVKEYAMRLDADILQPASLRGNDEVLDRLRLYAPDLIVVAAYGCILPPEILNLPRYGAVNVHGSLLPRHRGASPIQAAILAGDRMAGVTIMYMTEELDAGDMLARAGTPIDGRNFARLHDELAQMGADLLVETIESIAGGTAVAEQQDEALATYAPMIRKEDGHLDFSAAAEELERRIRAFDPWPGAFADYGGKTLKIWHADVAPGTGAAGTILDVSDDGLLIACGEDALLADVIQLPGRRRMAVRDFLKGNHVDKTVVLR